MNNFILHKMGVREGGRWESSSDLSRQTAARSPWVLAASSAIWTSRSGTSGSELSSTVSHCSGVVMFIAGGVLISLRGQAHRMCASSVLSEHNL